MFNLDLYTIIDGFDDVINNGYDFATPLLAQIKNLIPVVLPSIIGFIAFRKGWKFLKGALASA